MRTLLVLGCLLAALSPARASWFLDKSIDEWLTVLEKGAKPEARRGAAFALGRMGPVGSRALDDLAKRVKEDSDGSVRDMAAQSIGEVILSLDPPPESAWERCGAALLKAAREDGDPRVRRSAVYALGAFGTPATQPALKAALSDRSADVRQNAAWAVGRLGASIDGDAVVALRDKLDDGNALVRRDAAHAFMTLAKGEGMRDKVASAGPALFKMARDEKDAVARKTALAALSSVAGPEHASAANGITRLLDDRDPETARAAAMALAAVGGDHARRAVPVLRRALADDDPTVQALAAAGLSGAGPTAALAVDDLARALTRSKDPIVRRNCLIALGRVGKEAKEAVPAIAEAMETMPTSDDPNRRKYEEEVRYHAAEALSHIDYPANEKAMPALRRVIASDPQADVRLRCVEALFYVGKGEVLERHGLTEVLTKVLDESGDEAALVKYNCARVLALAYGEKAPDKAVDVLLVMLADTKTKVFYESTASGSGGLEGGGGDTRATARIGGSARFLAANALGHLGAKARNNPTVMKALNRAATDPEGLRAPDRDKRLDAEKLMSTAKKALEVLGPGS